MGILSDIYIKREVLQKMLQVLEIKEKHGLTKEAAGISITVSTDDKPNEYDQNVSAYVSQTEEQRKEKVKRFYVGNGKVFWTDIQGVYKPTKGDFEKQEGGQPAAAVVPVQGVDAVDDLPF